ncbi:active breakpoint cluster region-related protein isoform X1 [Leptopilina heterotoma]|uniref:active breakpoint cluster region-related protein isoform X1 n=1 Tax=Leptopilina heterotoma TaxID=63436 RepID=UPI001CA81843|nr:active breakpoint cluster region-related protein isoform X1 [Leptopilina heterotoma]
MSIFGDFQRVWVQRFPDSALPAAWEEDVRANLVKHQHKVAALREELEKEEFYVEYLERLLADVERHKRLANNSTTESKASCTESPSQSFHTAENSLNESSTIKNNENENTVDTNPVREDISTLQDKCVSELSSTLNCHRRPKSEIPRSPEKVPEFRRNSNPDVPSNYVTVIEVTGSSKKEKNEETVKDEEEKVDSDEKVTNEDAEDGDAEASEEEPYYDSVALDQTGEYVYIDSRVTANENNGNKLPVRRPPSLPESPGNQSNYVNIDYFIQFLRHRAAMDSEDEEGPSPAPPILLRALSTDNETGSSDAEPLSLSEGSLESPTPTTPRRQEKGKDGEDDRTSMVKCIVSSVIESETIYVECLNVMLQYMKAIRATLTTSQPVISEEEFGTMFYKIPELHAIHQTFLEGLRKKMEKWDCKTTVGEQFKVMGSNIGVYGAFLHNYARATDTVRRCSHHSAQFGEITRDIRLRGFPKGPGLSLEDLLHKPVARVQKNALVLHDLLKHTPSTHADHAPLTEALAMTRKFLDEFNIIQTKSMFPSHDRAQRRLVKNSFVVELADGHRKLRHLFLFNDVIACAKYKASGREKFTFELKWYIPVAEAMVLEDGIEPRENSPANVVALRSQACTVRDQILWEERNDEKRIRIGSRGTDKNRKKLAELEAQLVLASPNLVLRVSHKSQNRMQNSYTFFLSSEFERSQWIEAVEALQQGGQPPGSLPLTMYELQAWVTACRTYLQTDMGSYLLRSRRDESLLLGDLHLTLLGLTPPGLDRTGDLYIIVEVDSYGHYFKRARSRVARGQAPTWGETFVVELEGSQNLRILLYEECGTRSVLRGKCTQRLSRSWLLENQVDQVLKALNLGPATLDVSLKFVPSEVTLRRVPSAKPQGLFGAKIQQVCKREKRDVPFIVTACVREVERRGVGEVGLYRVSGSASDLAKLRKSFESNSYEAEQLLKEVDVHSVTGVLKLYLREMPEALFTDALYPAFLEAFQTGEVSRNGALRRVYEGLPTVNKAVIDFLLAHLIRVNKHEAQNKMSLHNLATVFGPTLLRPGTSNRTDQKSRDPLAAGTVDVMAQAGILYCFLQMQMQTQQSNQSL